jgi:hypothetical protein
MRTLAVVCLKTLVVVALAIVIVHFVPLAAVPLVLAAALALGIGALILVGLLVCGVAGAGALIGLLAVAVGLLAVFSPVWIPLGAILGVVWLVKKLGAVRRRPASAA